MPLPESLSVREKEVVVLLMQGKSNKEIAQVLGVAIRTVEFHVSHIYAKLGVASRGEAIIKLNAPPALAAQILSPGTSQPLETPDLRIPAGANQGQSAAGFRPSTVEKRRDPSENGDSFDRSLRRISMRRILFFIGLLLVACVGLAVLGTLLYFYFPAKQVNLANPSLVTGKIVESATCTPWQVTPTVWEATHTPVQPAPSAVIPR
jgi:DNA-binding CsgD family transcriptional regulator